MLGVVISSTVAGAATAPVAAAHFNAIAVYGLPANLLSVPVMGVLVIPAAVLAACLALVGAEAVSLHLMGLGLDWILFVAETVASQEGARNYVPTPPGIVLPLLSLSLLWVMLWQGRPKWVGLAPAALAFLLWSGADRPALLIADNGGLVGVMTPEGRALSRAKGAGFVARNWLENDGDGVSQDGAARRWPVADKNRNPTFDHEGLEVVHVIGKRGAEKVLECRERQLLVASVELEIAGPCRVLDPAKLRQSGSVAVLSSGTIVTASEVSGQRLWHVPDRKRDKRGGEGRPARGD